MHGKKVKLTYHGIFCAAQLDAGFLLWLAQPNFVEWKAREYLQTT